LAAGGVFASAKNGAIVGGVRLRRRAKNSALGHQMTKTPDDIGGFIIFISQKSNERSKLKIELIY
jgi:hypothetical protein